MIVGLDISTVRIDAAIIALDHDAHGTPTITFRTARLEQTKGATPLYRRVERARNMRAALTPIFADVDGWAIHLAYIEEPRGRFRNDALTGTFDSVCASIPSHIEVNALQPLAWRRELGLPTRLTKTDAVREAEDWLYHAGAAPVLLDEHRAEALLIALAGRQINTRAWAV